MTFFVLVFAQIKPMNVGQRIGLLRVFIFTLVFANISELFYTHGDSVHVEPRSLSTGSTDSTPSETPH
jgi:hypothetical protein